VSQTRRWAFFLGGRGGGGAAAAGQQRGLREKKEKGAKGARCFKQHCSSELCEW